MPVVGGRAIEYNLHKIDVPYETPSFAGGFSFSHGHYILNAGYDCNFDNIFIWEEPYQTYLAWKAGYKFYAPNRPAIWHMWDRTYRPKYGIDEEALRKKEGKDAFI